jgi:heme O synthase-like polyprenyltransferase
MKNNKHIGILILILVTVGFLLLLYPITFIFGLILSIIGFVWSIVNYKKAKKNKQSINLYFISLIISGLSSILAILWIVNIILVWSSFSKDINFDDIQIEQKDTLAVDIDYYINKNENS